MQSSRTPERFKGSHAVVEKFQGGLRSISGGFGRNQDITGTFQGGLWGFQRVPGGLGCILGDLIGFQKPSRGSDVVLETFQQD